MSMSMSEIIEQMESLAAHCESMVDADDPESIWRTDVEALNAVVEKLGNEYKGADAAAIIRAIMEKEGVSRTELAERTGCVRQNISQMLTRGNGNMRYDNFYKLANALGYEITLRKK